MQQERKLTGHYFLRAAILAGFAMYILYLVKSDNILFYIAPRNIIYVKLSAIGFYAIAVYQGFLAINSLLGKKIDCDCDHPPSRSWKRNTAAYSLFILPLVLGFMLPDSALGSALAAKRGVNLSSSQTTTKNVTVTAPSASVEDGTPVDPQLQALFKSDQYDVGFAQLGMKLYKQNIIQVKEEGYIEILSSLDLFMDNFIGKKIEISGFVYREDDMKPDQFVVARFSIQCCTADGSPFGMLVQFDQAPKLTKDTWVRITGTFSKSNYRGNEIMTLVADKVEKIPAAKSQYVYPNYEYIGG